MNQTLQDSTALLARTPAALDALLRGLPDSLTMSNEGGETWRPFDIVGHLIEGDKILWMTRARFLLEHGETRPFEPFDRGGHKREGDGKTLDQLLDAFAAQRRKSLEELHELNPSEDDLARRGMHPALGPVTLLQLLSTWAVHDLTHLHQLSRTMAYQQREAVGSWSKFLGVLRCAGHGE